MKIFAFIFCFALFVGGLLLMGYSFEFHGWEGVTFMAGILACAAAYALPIHLLPKISK